MSQTRAKTTLIEKKIRILPCGLFIRFSNLIAQLRFMERTLPSQHLSRPPTLPASFLLKMALPLVSPVALTVFISITVGETWPRSIAPGSGLMLQGLIASAARAQP